MTIKSNELKCAAPGVCGSDGLCEPCAMSKWSARDKAVALMATRELRERAVRLLNTLDSEGFTLCCQTRGELLDAVKRAERAGGK